MFLEIVFTIYFITLCLVVCFLSINFLKIRDRLHVHPKIIAFMLPFLINFAFSQTVFRPIYPLFSTLIPCLFIYFVGSKLERVRIIGLTGGIATGKSTLVKLIKLNLNIQIIDCDEISRRLSLKGNSGYRFILKLLGQKSQEFLHPLTRQIEREKFSNFIFNNPDMRKKLTSGMGKFIFYQIIKTVILNIINKKPLMLIDAPILYETKVLEYLCYPVVVVGCSEAIQVQRMIQRNNYNEDEAKQRISSQMPLSQKKKRAQIYIENTESEEKLLYNFLNKINRYVDKNKATSMRD